jgi:hypothetical protein
MLLINALLACSRLLYRIPEIAVRVFEQGALPLLEKSLHTTNCLAEQAVCYIENNAYAAQ